MDSTEFFNLYANAETLSARAVQRAFEQAASSLCGAGDAPPPGADPAPGLESVPSFEGLDVSALDGLPMFGGESAERVPPPGDPCRSWDPALGPGDAHDPQLLRAAERAFRSADLDRLDGLIAALPPTLPSPAAPLSPSDAESWLARWDEPSVVELVTEVRRLAW